MREDATALQVAEERNRHERMMAARQRFGTWADAAIKYVVAGNAGGVIAVVSFVGTARPPGGVPGLAIVSAAIFAIGLIAAGIALFGYWLASADGLPPNLDLGLRKALSDRIANLLLTWSGVVALISFVAFAIGAAIGIGSLSLIQFTPSRL